MRNSIQSITYILAGSLVYTSNGFSGGLGSGIVAIFGFVIFVQGLDMLKSGLDNVGKAGVNYMRMGAIIGGCAAILDMIPFMFVVSVPCFLAAFGLQLYGLMQFKESSNLNKKGKSGAEQIIYAKVIAIITGIVSIIPFLGDFVASIIALGALYFSFTGWLKIQDGLELTEIEYYEETELV